MFLSKETANSNRNKRLTLLFVILIAITAAASGNQADKAVVWTRSSDIGMVPDDPGQPLAARQKTGKKNAELLRSFLKKGTHLQLDANYYITVEYRNVNNGGTPFIVIDHPLHLKGGGLRIKYYGFNLKEGASLTAEGVRFESDGTFPFFWNGEANKHYGAFNSLINGMIGEISFQNCHFGCRMINMSFIEASPKTKAVSKSQVDSLGIRQFKVSGCTCDGQGAIFSISDGRIYDEFSITRNRVTEAIGAFLYYCGSHESGVRWVMDSCPLIVEDNSFRGAHYQSWKSTYHCPVLAKTNTVYFRRNSVDNYITRSYKDSEGKLHGMCAYDAYLSSRKVYYEDNVISNVFAYIAQNTTERKMSSPLCEWGKSKTATKRSVDHPAVRVFKRNKWKLDDTVVMSHLRGVAYGTDSTEAIIQLTDEEKKGLNANVQRAALEKKRQEYIDANYRVSLIHNYSSIDEVTWADNELDFGRGVLVCIGNVGKTDLASTPKYGRFVFEGNTIKARTMTGNLIGLAIPENDKTLKGDVVVRNNNFQFAEFTDFGIVFRRWSKPSENAWTIPMGDITVTGNRVVNGYFHLNGGLCGRVVITGNKTDKALSRDKALKQLRPKSLTADF